MANHINSRRMNEALTVILVGRKEIRPDQGNKLNVTFSGKIGKINAVTGGTNLNGDLKVEKGTIFLSMGGYFPHARMCRYFFNQKKTNTLLRNNEVVVRDDWINRNFDSKILKMLLITQPFIQVIMLKKEYYVKYHGF